MNVASNLLTVDDYRKAVEAFHILSRTILIEFTRHRETEKTRDRIVQNFIARSDMMLSSIFLLWEIKDYGSCWTIHRALMDRLFHLHVLNNKDQFDLFEDWSFKRQYEAANRVRSDVELKAQSDDLVENLTGRQKERYRKLAINPPVWNRPDPKETAKAMDLDFLYAYGYDFASRHVHPMADDGQEDFFNVTGAKPGPDFPDWRTVLGNSVLVGSLVIQEGLNASTLSWHTAVYGAVEGVRSFLGSASPGDHMPLARMAIIASEHLPLAASK